MIVGRGADRAARWREWPPQPATTYRGRLGRRGATRSSGDAAVIVASHGADEEHVLGRALDGRRPVRGAGRELPPRRGGPRVARGPRRAPGAATHSGGARHRRRARPTRSRSRSSPRSSPSATRTRSRASPAPGGRRPRSTRCAGWRSRSPTRRRASGPRRRAHVLLLGAAAATRTPRSMPRADAFITGLVLAAGGSKRLGRPKQLLAVRRRRRCSTTCSTWRATARSTSCCA